MFVRTIALLSVIMMSGVGNVASAQDTPRVGLAMGFPAMVNVILQVSDGLALRPEISVQQRSGQFTTLSVVSTLDGGVSSGNSTSSSSQATDDFWQVSAGLSGLFYLVKHDALRTYVSPRWAYLRDSTATSSAFPEIGGYSSTASGHLISGSFGAQYSFGRKFGAFGEVGIEFTRMVDTPDDHTARLFGAGQSVSRTLGSRSAAGIIVYF